MDKERDKISQLTLIAARHEAIQKYEIAGFCRDDAIIMTLDDIYAAQKLGNKFGNNMQRNK